MLLLRASRDVKRRQFVENAQCLLGRFLTQVAL